MVALVVPAGLVARADLMDSGARVGWGGRMVWVWAAITRLVAEAPVVAAEARVGLVADAGGRVVVLAAPVVVDVAGVDSAEVVAVEGAGADAGAAVVVDARSRRRTAGANSAIGWGVDEVRSGV